MIEILDPRESHIQRCAEYLAVGGLCAVPTETVYGLAANARNESAVMGIFRAKDRPLFDPLIVHVPRSWSTLQALADQNLIALDKMSPALQHTVQSLMDAFWPGPLTLVLPKHAKVHDLVTSGLDTVGLRCPDHPVFQSLLTRSMLPLAAPSANPFGRISPTCAGDVVQDLGERVPYVLDGGPCTIGLESTVLFPENEFTLTVLRPGGLAISEIQSRFPSLTLSRATETYSHRSPGQLTSHYAPRKHLFLLSDPLALPTALTEAKKMGLLSIFELPSRVLDAIRSQTRAEIEVHILSPENNWSLAAFRLFRTLRELDRSSADVLAVWTEAHSDEPSLEGTHPGLKLAIQDRLRRASIA